MAGTGWSRDATSPNNFNQNSSKNTSGNQSQSSGGSQSTSGNQNVTTNMSNISATGNQVLDQLLLQLSDRANVSDAQLDKQAPMPIQRWNSGTRNVNGVPTSGGWDWIDPLSGRTLSPDEAQKLSTDRTAQREQLVKEGGYTPGGTLVQRANQVARDQTVSQLIAAQGDYSKNAAFQDVEGLLNQQLRKLNESNVAEITRSAEGAGTSASSVRALLMNDAQARAAESISALGVKTAVDYGDVSSKFANILSEITSTDPVTNSLLSALGVAKGAVQQGSVDTSTNQTTTTQQSSNTNTDTSDIEDIIRKATSNNANSALSILPTPTNPRSQIEQGATF